jgi:hypothetical protein
MEKHRKKNQTETLEIKGSLSQIKNTEESHSSRLQQEEDLYLNKLENLEEMDKFLDT